MRAGTDDEREAEAPLVVLVEPVHARGFVRAQRVQAGARLLLARLPGQRAELEVPARQVRVAPEDPLFTCTPVVG